MCAQFCVRQIPTHSFRFGLLLCVFTRNNRATMGSPTWEMNTLYAISATIANQNQIDTPVVREVAASEI